MSRSKNTNPRATDGLCKLPTPGAAAAAHSAALEEEIRRVIAQQGDQISFAQFMELALYAPGLGYYSAGSRKFGEQGDFVTAPEISPLFSRCLARQCAEVLAGLGGGDILEFGAGTGTMAADILQELASLDRLPERYFIMELSADLKSRQEETLRQRAPTCLDRVKWLSALPERGFTGVVLGNELLDAMPVHLFCVRDGTTAELFVRWKDERFTLEAGSADDSGLAAALDSLHHELNLPDGYCSEYGSQARTWVREVGSFLSAGAVFLIDYGFPRHEYYHPQRGTGTLMCHYRHRAHADPFLHVGLQDITAHVDFTAVAEAALAGGLSIAGYTNQANFLLANGLTELASVHADNNSDLRAQLTTASQIKRLILPGEMGELFKVMALTRNLDMPLRGFMLRDDRGKL